MKIPNDPEPLQTISCIFCQGAVTFVNGATTKYFRHLQNEHDIHFNHGLALIINLMSKEDIDELEKYVLY